jgi:hypothetical protein
MNIEDTMKAHARACCASTDYQKNDISSKYMHKGGGMIPPPFAQL